MPQHTRFQPRPLPNPRLLAVARGDEPADLTIRGGQLVSVFLRTVVPGDVSIADGRIASVGPKRDAKEIVDAEGAILIPGFIDAHMHIESTMLRPSVFARLAAAHGTAGVVADPHEIANVLGLDGIRWMMRDAEAAPVRVWWTASSCVPSCHLEHSGATLTADDLAPLFDDDRVIGLAEMMNFPGAANADPAVLDKIGLGLQRRGPIDGHAPGLTGDLLQAYAAAGINSDHECTTAEEALEKAALGMQIYIREGSAARNLEALLPAVNDRNAHRFSFCTDDRHPGDLARDGHIDHVVRRAIALGLDPATAIAMGSLHTAQHYRLHFHGGLAPSYAADLAIVDDLHTLAIQSVYLAGELVAERGRCVLDEPAPAEAPRAPVTIPDDLSPKGLRVDATPRIRVIGMDPTQLVTEQLTLDATTRDGACVADVERDVLKIAVIERHAGTGRIGLAFVKGFGLRRGAIASTVGHDAHNLAVVGTNDGDMIAAARELARVGGGQTTALDGEILATLPLPIAGLMSDAPADKVIGQQHALLEAARDRLACPHEDPFMPLSFMPLPVIPKLKVSDMGLVDVERFDIVPIAAD
jgi:adenine deaminase